MQDETSAKAGCAPAIAPHALGPCTGMHYTFCVARDGAMSMQHLSDGVDEIWGIPAHEVLDDAQLLIDHVLPEDLSAFYASIEISRRCMQPWQHAFRIRARDGAIKRVFGSSRPEAAADGGVLWHGIMHQLPDDDASAAEQDGAARRLATQQMASLQIAAHPDVVRGDLPAAARLFTELASRSTNTERVGLWLLDEAGLSLQCVDLYMRSAQTHGTTTGFPVTACAAYFSALAEARVINAADVQSDPRFAPFLESYFEPNAIVSVLDVAILLDGRVQGVLSCEQVGRPRLWSCNDIQFLTMLADQFAQVMMSAKRRAAAAHLNLRDRAMDASLNGIVIADARAPGCPVVYANNGLLRATGRSAAQVLGHPVAALFSARADVVPEACALCVVWQGERGATVWAELNLSPVHAENGDLSHFIGVVNDITHHKRYRDALEWHANYDALTGLPNRKLCVERLDALLRADFAPLDIAVLTFDLDGLHAINEGWSRDTGNLVLLSTRDRLEHCLRREERSGVTTVLARTGGDNFTVLARAKDADAARTLAQRLARALEEPLPVRGRTLPVSACCGISLSAIDGATADQLVGASEAALKRAKYSGRGSIAFYDFRTNKITRERVEMDADMRAGLARGEFHLHYQTQVDARSGAVIAIEALLRWRHPVRGAIAPAAFIPIAEESGFIVQLGQWVLEQACAQCAAWRGRGLNLRVAVNLSPRQIGQPDMLSRVRATLAHYALPAANLELEITENALMHNLEEASMLLRGLRELGGQVSIDDFGTGYSSLRYLKMLPLDTLKIDKSFVDDVTRDAQAAAIVDAIIAMARSLDLEVIAEGVETPEQVAHLLAAGCHRMQGYHFATPASAEDLETALGARVLPRCAD